MTESFRAENDAQVAEAVAWAVAEQTPLEIVGRGSKRGLGRPVQAGLGLDLAGLSGSTLYEPDKLGLSARAYHRILKVARTIADLAGDCDTNETHVGEAVGYRVLDRHPH